MIKCPNWDVKSQEEANNIIRKGVAKGLVNVRVEAVDD